MALTEWGRKAAPKEQGGSQGWYNLGASLKGAPFSVEHINTHLSCRDVDGI